MLVWHVDASELQPEFRGAVEDTLSPLPDLWLVTQGFRSSEEQAALYAAYKAGGPKAAPPGSSPHEYGLAVDVALEVNGRASWDLSNPAWARLFAAIDASALLHSGRFFRDADHIERVSWRRHLLAGSRRTSSPASVPAPPPHEPGSSA